MATESAKDAMRPFHKVAATGSSWMRYLKKGISWKVPTVSQCERRPFQKKKTSFFEDKFRPLPLQPFSSSTVSISYTAFLHRTAVSVCICPSPTCLSWQWIGWRPPLAWNPKKSERSQNSHRVPRSTDGQGSQPSLAIKPPVDRVVSLHGYHPQASGNHGSFAC